MSDEYDDYQYEQFIEDELAKAARPLDRKVEEAKQVLLDRYFSSEADVYYSRQLEIWMEQEFFHWITGRALNELAGKRKIGFTAEVLPNQKQGPTPAKIHFYYPVKH